MRLGVVASTDAVAQGAWPNGTRVRKVQSASGDTHQDGALAKVTGSIEGPNDEYGYFVEWDDIPGVPVFVAGRRLALVSSS